MIILRKEHFGGILYDTSTLTYKFIPDPEGVDADFVMPVRKDVPRTDILSAPVRVYFEFTRRCNLSCRHCFTGSSPAALEGMPISVVFKVLREMKNMGVINVRFTGGEPTFRSDWYEVLGYAKDLGLIVSLSTNGVYTDPDRTIQQIIDLKLDQVTLSLDGLEDVHDYIRGEGTFRSVLYAAMKLKEAGVNLRLTTVLTKMNVDEIPELVEIASEVANVINFVYMRPLGRGALRRETGLNFKQHFKSSLEVKMQRRDFPDLLILHSALGTPERIRSEPDVDLAFPYGNTALSISAEGSIWPHHYSAYQTPIFWLGNLTGDKLEDVWFNSSRLDEFREWSRVLYNRCEKCREFTKTCAGINFEMEIARLMGDTPDNPFCINRRPAPSPLSYLQG